MNILTKNYLLERIEDCKSGLCRWDDAAWSFIVSITNDNDSSLFTLATPEIREEIIKTISKMNQEGIFIVHIAHVGSSDATTIIKKLEELLILGGFIR